MIEVGRLCYKIAGREAGKPCVIVDVIDDHFVLVDGLVRRKRCNVNHLHFTPIVLNIKKGESTDSILKILVEKKIIAEVPKKGEKKEKKEKPVKVKKVKPKKEKQKKEEKKESKLKKEEKKASKPKEAKRATKSASKKSAKKK